MVLRCLQVFYLDRADLKSPHMHPIVQYTQTELIRRGTLRLDSIRMLHLNSISHGVASRKLTSGMTNQQHGKRFVSIWSHRLKSTTFSTTLHSPPEVKIHEVKIHEPSLFHKLQLIRTIRVDSIESSRINNIFNPPYIVQECFIFYVSCKSTSGMSYRQRGKRFVLIRWSRVQELIFG